jgi:hypothetical protein
VAGCKSDSLATANESFDTNANIQHYLDSLSGCLFANTSYLGNNPCSSQQSSNRAIPSGSGRTANNASSRISDHVFIGVKCGDEHRIAEINVHDSGMTSSSKNSEPSIIN